MNNHRKRRPTELTLSDKAIEAYRRSFMGRCLGMDETQIAQRMRQDLQRAVLVDKVGVAMAMALGLTMSPSSSAKLVHEMTHELKPPQFLKGPLDPIVKGSRPVFVEIDDRIVDVLPEEEFERLRIGTTELIKHLPDDSTPEAPSAKAPAPIPPLNVPSPTTPSASVPPAAAQTNAKPKVEADGSAQIRVGLKVPDFETWAEASRRLKMQTEDLLGQLLTKVLPDLLTKARARNPQLFDPLPSVNELLNLTEPTGKPEGVTPG